MKIVLWCTMLSGEGGGGSLLDIDPGLMFWTVVTFVILLFVLRGLAWKPIVKALQNREEKIRDSLQQAEIARREAESLMAKNSELIGKAQQEAQDILRKAKEMAEELKAGMVDKAKSEAEKLVEDAKKEIENEKALRWRKSGPK